MTTRIVIKLIYDNDDYDDEDDDSNDDMYDVVGIKKCWYDMMLLV